jgi:HK97 family phage major capsid protein
MTSGTPAAQFVGSGAPVPAAKGSLSNVSLGVAKVSSITYVTDEVVHNASDAASQLISSDIANSVAQGLDEAFLNPDNSGDANLPEPESITHAGVQIASSGTSVSNIVSDAKRCMAQLDSVNVPLGECTWIATQRLGLYLSSLLGTNNQWLFDDLKLDGTGTWLGGLPILFSGNAFGSNSPTEDLLILAHGDSIGLADGAAEISASREAALQADDAPSTSPSQLTSLWQENLYGLKCERYVNWTLRRSGTVCTVRSINV